MRKGCVMKIERIRYVVTRNNDTEIFCGLARNYTFKPINDMGTTAIKTYLSRKKAESSFESSWYIREDYETIYDLGYNVLEVKEIIEST